ncbi:hypothetical protein ACFE04_004073 [Oxalis oulophora]
METTFGLQFHGKTTLTNIPKTLTRKPFKIQTLHLHKHKPLTAQVFNENWKNTKHTTLVVESYHQHQSLNELIVRLKRKGSCPLQLLTEDGDWTKDYFWAVIVFLVNTSRSSEILQVFNMWGNIEKSRINEFNYAKVMRLLGEEGLVEDSTLALEEMKSFGLTPSVEIYNSIIHCYADNGRFDEARSYLYEMKEMNLAPVIDTYNGLIQAYGKHKMYDDIAKCLGKLKRDGCSADHVTCNLLIKEFSRAGLLKRMEKYYLVVRSKRMILYTSSLVEMLAAYSKYGILEKMEYIYRKLSKTKVILKDDLVREIAGVYIQNNMFSKLYDLGLDLSITTGRTHLVWCLRLLSHACLLSRKGMDIVVEEMKQAEVPWTITTSNIILLAYLKMKDFNRMRNLLSEFPAHCLKPDIVTVGILFDAIRMGYNGSHTLDGWRQLGLLYRSVEMNTDPLVLIAFGKGNFLKECEEKFSSLEPVARERQQQWTYQNFIGLVTKHNARQHPKKESSEILMS